MKIHILWKRPSYPLTIKELRSYIKWWDLTITTTTPTHTRNGAWSPTINVLPVNIHSLPQPSLQNWLENELFLLLEIGPSSFYYPCVSWPTCSRWTNERCRQCSVENTLPQGKRLLTAFSFQLSMTAGLCQSLYYIQPQGNIFCNDLDVSTFPIEPSSKNATPPLPGSPPMRTRPGSRSSCVRMLNLLDYEAIMLCYFKH